MNKTKLFLFSLLSSLIANASALADPIALRNNLFSDNYGLHIGYKESNIFFKTGDIPISLEVTLPYDAFSVSSGRNFVLLGNSSGFGLDSFLGTGIGVATINPGLLLDLTPSLKVRYINDIFGCSLGLVSPSKIKISNTFETRFPLLLEANLMTKIFSRSVGIQANGGIVFVPGLTPSLSMQGGLFLGW